MRGLRWLAGIGLVALLYLVAVSAFGDEKTRHEMLDPSYFFGHGHQFVMYELDPQGNAKPTTQRTNPDVELQVVASSQFVGYTVQLRTCPDCPPLKSKGRIMKNHLNATRPYNYDEYLLEVPPATYQIWLVTPEGARKDTGAKLIVARG